MVLPGEQATPPDVSSRMARRRGIGLVVLGGLGAAAVSIWLAIAPRRSPVPVTVDAANGGTGPSAAPTVLLDHAATRTAGIAPIPDDAGSKAEREARSLIATSRSAYGACDTYEDNGTYDIVFRGDAGHHNETEFHTVFAGPDAVRFAYRDKADRFFPDKFTQLVATDAGVQATVPWQSEPETEDSLASAVDAMRGVSHGLVSAVLPLLPSGLDTRSALDVAEPRLAGTDEIDGIVCDRIESIRRRPDGTVRAHLQMWISQSDSLIHRLSEDFIENDDDSRKFNTEFARERESLDARLREAGWSDADIGRTHTTLAPLTTFDTVTYHPKCNEPVRPETLRATDGSL